MLEVLASLPTPAQPGSAVYSSTCLVHCLSDTAYFWLVGFPSSLDTLNTPLVLPLQYWYFPGSGAPAPKARPSLAAPACPVLGAAAHRRAELGRRPASGEAHRLLLRMELHAADRLRSLRGGRGQRDCCVRPAACGGARGSKRWIDCLVACDPPAGRRGAPGGFRGRDGSPALHGRGLYRACAQHSLQVVKLVPPTPRKKMTQPRCFCNATDNVFPVVPFFSRSQRLARAGLSSIFFVVCQPTDSLRTRGHRASSFSMSSSSFYVLDA